MSDSEARAKARANKLDDAIRDFFDDLRHDEDDGGPYSLVSWVLGIAATGIDDGEERDAAVFESAPGANLYTVRGLSDATAEFFRRLSPASPYYNPYGE